MLNRVRDYLRRRQGCICWYARYGTDDSFWRCPRHGRVTRGSCR
jgi:hypothetical protein